jgi:hypothetical protein
MRRSIFICLLLAGITLMIYWPAGSYEVVFYDDTFFTDNPAVQSGLNGHSLVWALTGVVAANWHPVTSLSFVVTHQIFGNHPGAEHLVNVVFHALNAALLFLVLRRMTAPCPPAPPGAGPAGRSLTRAMFSPAPPPREERAGERRPDIRDQIPSPQPAPRLGGARE